VTISRRHANANALLKDPTEQLEQLRRSSAIEFEHLKSPVHVHPPLRELPETSLEGGELHEQSSVAETNLGGLDGAQDDKTAGTDNKAVTTVKPVFKAPDFGVESTVVKAEEILSPTEER
jgi:glycogenin glucosyltransferase